MDIIRTVYYINSPWRAKKEFLLFYMCQLWALHVVTKRQFFYIYLITVWLIYKLIAWITSYCSTKCKLFLTSYANLSTWTICHHLRHVASRYGILRCIAACCSTRSSAIVEGPRDEINSILYMAYQTWVTTKVTFAVWNLSNSCCLEGCEVKQQTTSYKGNCDILNIIITARPN